MCAATGKGTGGIVPPLRHVRSHGHDLPSSLVPSPCSGRLPDDNHDADVQSRRSPQAPGLPPRGGRMATVHQRRDGIRCVAAAVLDPAFVGTLVVGGGGTCSDCLGSLYSTMALAI